MALTADKQELATFILDSLTSCFNLSVLHRDRKTARMALEEVYKIDVVCFRERHERWLRKAQKLFTKLVLPENRAYWRSALPYERSTEEYHNWRINCLNRDNWRCTECKGHKELNVHHIKSYKDHVSLRIDVDNGITLCKPCHIAEHKRLRNA
jgi:5-methylcytosine-specific restriction endonuclease McrA